ncbi:MAG: hypothetical protein A3I44_02215 [Candidatus Sungbacteria bacterium RIFCSPLOWO2_02_FULL_51_17]|nr:MAG: hypothetical protein A2676_04145 [Candidatus Sungbacteria bacterium RIFCSPHIGHO2_01_FULL_51_22]OHA04916.1 MAG: hypothetical protein A3B29_01055 [Candidatus Sungbacteria bacterium RIFCSPLOWO2_01_FULL_51_34]OHA11092.1 MAG: hypothetical protein A3I44_02215 [Candidatus Sungbacteria bacterium RIFCSPLOWO2_02_FULL_51_17]
MYSKTTVTSGLFILSAIGIAGLLVPHLALAQYDYYDPYSNSNIDYFPTNPVNTRPSRTESSGTSGGTSSGTVSGGIAGTATLCANTPKANPQNTRSVEIRDTSGKVFYLSPPKEQLIGLLSYPESSQQIYKITYNASGKNKEEVGLITVNNKCYPKYGYVQNSTAVTAPKTSSSTPPPSGTQHTDLTTVPENATAVRINPETGAVYNAKTGEFIPDARYDAVARKIYYKDSASTFGKVFTDTTGYVNIDTRRSATSADSAQDPDTSDISGGDPDRTFLNIDVSGDDLEKFRAEVSAAERTQDLTVGGWDPDIIEEIVGRPHDIKTPEELKVYVEATALNDGALKGIEIKKDSIEVESRESGKLFWFIPVEISSTVIIKYNVRDSSEDWVSMRFPWWHIFVKKAYGPGALKTELIGGLTVGEATKASDPMPQNEMSRISQTLQIVSTILKTKHDTVKNSISNVR